LARLLAEPNRRFDVWEFYPPPPGAAPLPYLGRDDSSDHMAMEKYEGDMTRLVQEIKEADDAHDVETADKLRAEFNRLEERVTEEKKARKRGHKKRCGSLSPRERAGQALRVGFNKLKARFRRNGLPRLADHLDKYLENGGGKWWYAPTPGTAHWHVTFPDARLEK
jgi:hypothetical protein